MQSYNSKGIERPKLGQKAIQSWHKHSFLLLVRRGGEPFIFLFLLFFSSFPAVFPFSPTPPPPFFAYLWVTFLSIVLSNILILHLFSLWPSFWGTSEDRSHLWLADWVTEAVPVDTHTHTHLDKHTDTQSWWLCRGLRIHQDVTEMDSE